jgi:hypothetical protein
MFLDSLYQVDSCHILLLLIYIKIGTLPAKAYPEWKAATDYARARLLGQYLILDLDDKIGKDPLADGWPRAI